MPESFTPTPAWDRQIYDLARVFLFEIQCEKLTSEIIESYLTAPHADRPSNLCGIYERLLTSAQNANMKAGVIGGSIGGVKNLGPLLGEFDPAWVVAHYGADSTRLLDDIVKRLKPNGKIRRTHRSFWPQYCKTVLSAANFLSRFKSVEDLYSWVDFFDGDARARPGLPLLLSQELKGFGFALSCDFLKELGYANFGKPDVHIREIFTAARLCVADASDYEILKSICRVAESASVSPYTIDKVFWLIGSGYFYNHRHIGRDGRISRPKEKFMASLP